MADTVKLRNGEAIDARFKAVDDRLSFIGKDVGRLEERIGKVEQDQDLHHDGLARHDNALVQLTKAVEDVTLTLKEFSTIKSQVQGGIILWKWVLVPIGGFSGILYIASKLMEGFLK